MSEYQETIPEFSVTLEIRIEPLPAPTASSAWDQAAQYVQNMIGPHSLLRMESRGYHPSRVHETLVSRRRRAAQQAEQFADETIEYRTTTEPGDEPEWTI